MPEPIRVGRLRWPVSIVLRSQIPDPNSAGIIETLTDAINTHADIVPLGPMAFYGAVNATGDQAPTHRVTVRWTDEIDTRHAILRTTTRPDGTTRAEVFRIRRALGDLEGRKRFSTFDCQLETSQ